MFGFVGRIDRVLLVDEMLRVRRKSRGEISRSEDEFRAAARQE